MRAESCWIISFHISRRKTLCPMQNSSHVDSFKAYQEFLVVWLFVFNLFWFNFFIVNGEQLLQIFQWSQDQKKVNNTYEIVFQDICFQRKILLLLKVTFTELQISIHLWTIHRRVFKLFLSRVLKSYFFFSAPFY